MRNVLVGTGLVTAGIYSCSFVVYPGEGAVLYNRLWGLKEVSYTEGMHLRILGLDEVKLFNIRLRPRVLNTMTGTKDLQMVNIRLRVLFRPQVEKLPQIYRELGPDYDERVLPSLSNEILKAVVAEYKAEELIQKRDQVSARIASLMIAKVATFGIEISDLSLVDIHFGKEFMLAVEAKQVAQQEAERFKYIVMENEQRKLASVTRAEGEAEAAKLISDSVKSYGNGLVKLRQIETAVEIAQKVAASPNVHFIPEGASVLLQVPKASVAQPIPVS